MRSERNRRNNRLVSIAILSSAVANVVGLLDARAATLTWNPTSFDPNSSSYTTSFNGSGTLNLVNGENLYLWRSVASSNGSATANWESGGVPTGYVSGSTDVVFTDNLNNTAPNAEGVIRVEDSALDPKSMTFSHVAGGTGTDYYFLTSSDFQNGASNVSSSALLASGATVWNLTLDTGFIGTVHLRASSEPTNLTSSLTTIRSGTLSLDASNALGATANGRSPVNLAGGTLVQTINPASSGDVGTLTVSGPGGTLAQGTANTASARLWNGTIIINSGAVLTLESTGALSTTLAGTLSLASSTGTLQLADVGSNITSVAFSGSQVKSTTLAFNLGTGSSEILMAGSAPAAVDLGSLIGGPGTKLSGQSAVVTGGTLTTFSIGARGDSTTFAGTIRDGSAALATAAVTKVGAGTLTLSGTSTFTGTLTVNSGTVAVTGAGSISTATISLTSPSNAASTATLRLDNSTTNSNDRISDSSVIAMSRGNLVFVGNLSSATAENAGSLVISNGLNSIQTIASGSGSPASLTFSNATMGFSRTGGVVDFNLDPNVSVNFTAAPATPNGIIGGYATFNTNDWATVSGGNVVAYTGYTTDDGVNNTASTWSSTQNIDLTTTNAETIAVPTTINTIRLSGTGAKSIAINSGQALTIGAGGILATGTGGGTISGTGSITAGAVGTGGQLITLVQDPNNTLTISAPISDNGAGGTVALIKAGAGTLILSGSNSYTGGTQLLAGTLKVGIANFFGATPQALTINFGTAFDIGGFNQQVTTLTLVNGSVLNSGGSATLNGTAFAVQNGLISASLSGTGTLTKSSSTGIVTLTASNAYTGGTSITAGTLALAAAGAFPSGGTLSISGGGTLDIGTNNVTTGVASLTNGGIAGTGIVTGTSFLANGSQTFTVSAVLAGTGATLTKGVTDGVSNGGTLALTNNNTYTGATTIGATGTTSMLQGGFVIVNSLADGGLPSGIGASTSDPSNLVLNNGELIYTGAGGSTNRSFTIAAGTYGGILSSGTGPLTLSFTGAITTSGGTLDLDGTFAGANTFDPDITGTTNLLKQGVTEWQILGTRGYSGSTTIQNGTLTVDTIANGTQPSGIGVSDNTSGNLIFTGGGLNYIAREPRPTAFSHSTAAAAERFSPRVRGHWSSPIPTRSPSTTQLQGHRVTPSHWPATTRA